MLVINLKAVSPVDFWQLTPNEAGLIVDWHIEQIEREKPKTGRLTDDQYDQLEARRAKLRAQGLNVI